MYVNGYTAHSVRLTADELARAAHNATAAKCLRARFRDDRTRRVAGA